jgi:hypothetical protein
MLQLRIRHQLWLLKLAIYIGRQQVDADAKRANGQAKSTDEALAAAVASCEVVKLQLLSESSRAKGAQIQAVQTQKALDQAEARLEEQQRLVQKVRRNGKLVHALGCLRINEASTGMRGAVVARRGTLQA